MRTLVVISVLLWSAHAFADPSGHFTFRSFGAAEGLENLRISQIAQTPDGLLWLATEDGLYSYDGAHFHRLDTHDGLPSNQIFSLLSGARGLWVGSAAGLALVSHGHVGSIDRAHGMPGATVNALATGPDNTVWAATEAGLFHQVGDRFELAPGWPGGSSAAVSIGSTGDVIAGRGNALATLTTGGSWSNQGKEAAFGKDRIDAIAQTSDGLVWVRSALHLWSCDHAATTCRDRSDVLPDVSEVGRMLVDHQGTLWVSTRRGLAHRLASDQWEQLDTARGLPARSVITAFEDREGSLWIAADQLYQLLGRGLWRSYTAQHDFPADTVWTARRDHAGALWVGGNRGVLEAVGETWVTFPGTEPYTIQALVEVGNGFYASGTGSEIMRLDRASRSTTFIGPDPSVAGDGIASMVFDRGILWAGTSNAGLIRMTEENGRRVWQREVLPDGDPREDVNQLLLDRAGRLWAAGSAGLAVLDDGRWRRFTERDGLEARPVSDIIERASGELCIAYTESFGITCFRFTHKLAELRHLSRETGLASDKIYLLGEDRAGRLYAGMGVGVDVIVGTTVEHFTAVSGLVGDECAARAFWADLDGDVLIGTTRGLARFAANRYTGPPSPVAPIVTSFQLGDVPIEPGARARERGATSLAVHFAVPTFANRGRLKEEVRLLPIEQAWRSTRVDEVRYTHLSYGDYTFEVRARITPGSDAVVTQFGFSVARAWWQTSWFRLVALLALLALLGVAFAWRTRVATARAAKQIVARSEASFRALIEQSPDAVFVHRDGALVYVNPKTVSYLGYQSASELLGQPLASFVHPNDREFVVERSRAVMTTGEASPVREVAMLRKGGSSFTVEVSGIKVDFGGRPAILETARDCTERKALEAHVMFSDRMASIGTLAAGIAHEVNSPLAYVKTNLELVAEELASHPAQSTLRMAVADALEGALRVQGIVKGLKTFSRVEHEPAAPIDVHRAIDLALRMTSNEIRHRCRIVTEYRPLPLVMGDESKLGQVFINLLINAAHAIPVAPAEDHQIRIATYVDASDRAVIEIRDTGCGMRPEVMRRVFEPFFTTKGVGEGTGLGLSICHGIVQSLGGELTVDSTLGAGSTFRVMLPGAIAPDPKPVVDACESKRSATSYKILVIDDDERVRTSIARILRKHHTVTLAANPSEALARFADGLRYDAILCDLMMPGVTGMALHAQLEAIMPDQARKMLFMTGGAFTIEAKEFVGRSSITSIEKPFDMVVLRTAIERIVQQTT